MKLASEVKTLYKFLETEGYEKKEINPYVEQKEAQRMSKLKLMFSFLHNPQSDNYLLPKSFMQWKQFIKERKNLRKFGRVIENCLARSDIYHSFKVLKAYTNYTLQIPRAEMFQM